MFNWYQNIKNNIDFYLRNQFKVSKKGFYVQNEPKEELFEEGSEAFEKEKYLYEKYNLEGFKNNSATINYLSSLAILDLLDYNLGFETKKEELKVLDIGSKNWFYAQVEHAFFGTKNEKNIYLTGIELDAYRVYSSFYSRKDAAEFYIKTLDNTKYIAGDFLKHHEKYDYITWFYPFVTDYPLLKWGLPLNYLKPETMLEHAYNSLNTDGKMIIVNQTREEYKIQKALFEKLNIPYEQKGEFESELYKSDYGRFISVVSK